MSNKIIEIASVVIKLENKQIELTANEARIVLDELSKLLKDDKTDDLLEKYKELSKKLEQKEKLIPYPVPYPIYPVRPIYVEPYWQPSPHPRRYEITCKADNQQTLCINTVSTT